MSSACLLEHGHMHFQGLQKACILGICLWYIPTISHKLAEDQRCGPWWICQDKTRIVHPEIGVRLFHGISFQGTLHRPFQEDLIKKCPSSKYTSSCILSRE